MNYTWTGLDSNSFDDSGNYDPVGIPTSDDTLTFNSYIGANSGTSNAGTIIINSSYSGSLIYGGVVNGNVTITSGIIDGGTFNGTNVINYGAINGGTFNGTNVTNYGAINGGTYIILVCDAGSINSVITSYLRLQGGTIVGCTVTNEFVYISGTIGRWDDLSGVKKMTIGNSPTFTKEKGINGSSILGMI